MVIGGNPAVSRMSFIQLPDPMKRLGAIVERGGRLVFVNPRRIESAKAAGEHVFIRPDTDVYFLLRVPPRGAARATRSITRASRAHMTGFERARRRRPRVDARAAGRGDRHRRRDAARRW